MSALVELLIDAARRAGGRDAVHDGTRSATYAELERSCARLASGLAALGVGPGTRVGILSRNRIEFVELYFALAALGAVAVPINWRLRPGEVRFVLEDAGARLVVVEPDFVEACAGHECLVLGEAPPGTRPLSSILAEGPALAERLERAPVAPHAPAVQMYTSGTTGLPKGAMLSQASVAALVRPWLRETGLREGERFLQVTPLFHVGGMLLVMTVVAARAGLRTMPEFLPRPALELLAAEQVHAALFVPAMIGWMLAEARRERPALPHLRLVIYGAAPMPVAMLEEALEVFGCDFLQGYGLTETAGVATVLRPEDHRWPADSPPPARLASAGRPIACNELRLVDEQGRDVPTGQVGEVLVRGANVMLGYWQRPEADARELVDGWLHTGDLGRMDAEGYLYLVDRSKDMVCVSGENVYPREVEEVLASHPAVAECAVIGIPSERFGEEVLALVVPRAEAGATPLLERTLVQHCRASLARFKCPTRVELRATLPRNAAGKLLKKDLREPYWRGRERRV